MPKNQAISKAEFFVAAQQGLCERVRGALETNPEWAREYDEDGFTALQSAAYFAHPLCVEVLLELSEVDAGSEHEGYTALMLAAGDGNERIVSMLLPRAHARATSHTGDTALMKAVMSGSIQCVRALLPVSDAKAIRADGKTALICAARGDDLECIKALVPVSDVAAVEKTGMTALDWSRQRPDWKCADILAAAMSEKEAKRLRKSAPKNVSLPLCAVVIERAELKKAVAETALVAKKPGSGRAKAPAVRTTRATRRV